VVYNGKDNTFKFEKEGIRHTLICLKYERAEVKTSPKALLVTEKEFLKHVQDEEVSFSIVAKPRTILTNTRIDDLPIEVHKLLEEYVYIVVDDFPNELQPVRSISHHIDLIPRASFPNKATYIMTPIVNEEIRKQVQELLNKGLVKERLSPCDVPTILSLKKG
jgi:hypothetical protein